MDGMLLEAEARRSIVVLICIVVLSAPDCPKLKRHDTQLSCYPSKTQASRLLS